eukprot:6196201-Pleurochrysis_carterae.AAC.2
MQGEPEGTGEGSSAGRGLGGKERGARVELMRDRRQRDQAKRAVCLRRARIATGTQGKRRSREPTGKK